MKSRALGPFWILLAFVVTILAHVAGVILTRVTIGLMAEVEEFALAVSAHNNQYLPAFRVASFAVTTVILTAYAWPVLRHSLTGYRPPVPAIVQRRLLSLPLVVGCVSFGAWLFSIAFFPLLTLAHFGRWSFVLMSQHVLSPLVAGFLASTTSYLLVESITRAQVIPRVFPEGLPKDMPPVKTLGVQARLSVLVLAVAFTPLFTMLGLITAAEDRVLAGRSIDEVLATVGWASRGIFLFYVGLGTVLTIMIARSLTRPLERMASAVGRVRAGDLGARVEVRSTDEVGVLGEGVNAMVEALREREHILRTFGRVVEPDVRDRLLSGGLEVRGETRTASILFVDLRRFTTLAEQEPPEKVVLTLNGFFGAMNGWVRENDGFVDKFIGDAMLVVFGLFDDGPDRNERSAAAALRTAIGMRERLERLNDDRAGHMPLEVSIGVHTGEVIAGTIGAEERHEYTVIGDTVNVAARLQQLSKDRGCAVLVSEETYQLARRAGLQVEAAAGDAVQLRGRRREIRPYALG